MRYKQLHTDGADLLIWEVTESVAELMQLIPHFERYQNEFEQLKTIKRQLEFLAARVAFQQLVGTHETITYTAEGKPLCKSNNYQLSITHTQKWVAVLIHPTLEVGIDIEAPSDRFAKLYTRFLTPNEQQNLVDLSDLRRVQLAWSAKETLYKIIGMDAVDFATQLEIHNFELATQGQFKGSHVPTGYNFILNYIIYEHFNLVYCLKK